MKKKKKGVLIMNEQLTEKSLEILGRFCYNEGYRKACKDMTAASVAFAFIGVATFTFLTIKDHLKKKKEESTGEKIES